MRNLVEQVGDHDDVDEAGQPDGPVPTTPVLPYRGPLKVPATAGGAADSDP